MCADCILFAPTFTMTENLFFVHNASRAFRAAGRELF